MLTIKKNEIPLFLQKSKLYKGIYAIDSDDESSEPEDDLDDRSITIDKKYFIDSDYIKNSDGPSKFENILYAYQYWMVTEPNLSLYNYITSNLHRMEKLKIILDKFDESDVVLELKSFFFKREEQLFHCIRYKLIRLLHFLINKEKKEYKFKYNYDDDGDYNDYYSDDYDYYCGYYKRTCYSNKHYKLKKRFNWPSKTSACCAYYGHLDLLKSLYYDFGCLIHKDTMAYAAQNNHLEIIKFLQSIDIEIDSSTIRYACIYNRMEIIKHLADQSEINEKLASSGIREACKHGHIDLVKYLHIFIDKTRQPGWDNHK